MNYIVLDLEWNQSPNGKEDRVDHDSIGEITGRNIDNFNVISFFAGIRRHAGGLLRRGRRALLCIARDAV